MKDTQKTYKFIVLVIGIMALATLATVSFAFFSTQFEEVGEAKALKGKAQFDGLRISLTESTDGVKITNAYPMPDELGLRVDPYTFTVTSEETTKTIRVKVVLEVLNTSTLADELVSVNIDGTTKKLNSELATTPSESTYKSAYEIFTFDLNPNEAKTYDLRAWINADGTLENAQNKTWASRALFIPEENVQ